MNRKQFLCSVAGVGATELLNSSCVAEGGPKPPLAVTILTTSIRTNLYMSRDLNMPTRCLKISPTFPHITVAIQNISAQPLRLWDENNSWGSGNLRLEISRIGDKQLAAPIKVERHQSTWFANSAQFSVLAPGEMIMRELTLEMPSKPSLTPVLWKWPYTGFPAAAVGSANSLRMRAVYEVTPDGLTRQGGVWTGAAASEEHDFVVYLTEGD